MPVSGLDFLFDVSQYPERWHCGHWSQLIGWTYITSDLLIFLAYVGIPISLLYYNNLLKASTLKLNYIFYLFAGFILLCGTTHLIDAIIFWHPIYNFMAFVLLTTSVFSLATLVVIFTKIPMTLQIISEQTQAKDLKLELETLKAKEAQEENLRLIVSNEEIKQHIEKTELLFFLSQFGQSKFKTSDAFKFFISSVCKLKRWEVGHAYNVVEDNETHEIKLISSKIWHFDEAEKYQQFKEISENIIFKNGMSLPGKVYQQQKICWIEDVHKNSNFQRAKLIKDLPLHGAVGVPIKIKNNTVAVIEFFSKKAISKDDNLGTMISIAAYQLGSMLEKNEREKKLKKNYSELKKLHKELLNTQSQLIQQSTLVSIGQLAAGIAHEINTPIQYIGDNNKFLQDYFVTVLEFTRKMHALSQTSENLSSNDILENIKQALKNIDLEFISQEVPEAIQQSLEGVNRVSDIVKAMKEFSHPGLSEKTPTDLNRALKNTITVSKNEWKYIAEINTHLDPELPLAYCLPNEMNQVFLNLIVNAAHAIEAKIDKNPNEKGFIDIETRKEGNFIEVRIKDNGIGVAEKNKDRIFDPFFTTKEVGKGTGQGLSIAHSIVVQKHNGEILLDSKVDVGTTFIVRIPIN